MDYNRELSPQKSGVDMSDSNDQLPSTRSISLLPAFAQVAIAARAVERVLPIYNHWQHRNVVEYAYLRRTIVRLQEVVTNGTKGLKLPHNADAMERASSIASFESVEGVMPAVSNATAAYWVAQALDRALGAYTFLTDPHRESGRDAAEALKSSLRAATAIGADEITTTLVISSLNADYVWLLDNARDWHWTNDTPIPRQFFDRPLWKSDATIPAWAHDPEVTFPEQVQERAAGAYYLIVELDIPDDMSVSVSDLQKFSREAVAHLDDIHRGLGGGGLKVTRVEVEEPSAVPAEVRS